MDRAEFMRDPREARSPEVDYGFELVALTAFRSFAPSSSVS